jgi:hypothetical protein
MSRRFTKRQRIAPASFFFEPEAPVRRKRASALHNVAQVELPKRVIAAPPPETEIPPPPSTPSPVLPALPPPPEPPQHRDPVAGPGTVVCQWFGRELESPEKSGNIKPFLVDNEAHFFHHRRGVRRKPAPAQPAPATRALTWAEIERRNSLFWERYRAQLAAA